MTTPDTPISVEVDGKTVTMTAWEAAIAVCPYSPYPERFIASEYDLGCYIGANPAYPESPRHVATAILHTYHSQLSREREAEVAELREVIQKALGSGTDEAAWPPGTKDSDALVAFVAELRAVVGKLPTIGAWIWSAAGWQAPFSPGPGNNDGSVRDASGNVVADCNGFESRAEIIAAVLNAASRAAALESIEQKKGEGNG